MYPLPVERVLEVFQLRVTNVDATVMGKIWMFSDCKEKQTHCLHLAEVGKESGAAEKTTIFGVFFPQPPLFFVL